MRRENTAQVVVTSRSLYSDQIFLKLTQDHVMAQLMIFQDWTKKGKQKMQILMSMLDPKRNNKDSIPGIPRKGNLQVEK